MARPKRGASAHADVVGDPDDVRARLVIRLDALADPDGRPLGRRSVSRWFVPVGSSTAVLAECPGASIVLDAATYELHLGDSGGSHEGAHPGGDFVAAATLHGVEVFVIDTERVEGADIDMRRLRSSRLDEIAGRGGVLGGLVRAFEVVGR